MIKAVVFDLDDTLISEFEYIKSGYTYISKLLSTRYNLCEKQLYNKLMYLFEEDSSMVFNRLLDEYDISYTKEIIMELVDEYRNHIPKITFFDDVVPCIKQLKTKGMKLGIITDGYKKAQRNKINVLGLEEIVDHIIVTDEIGREFWKPHPKAFELMRETLNVEFDEMFYIGDNPKKDFLISSIHPITTLRIIRGGLYEKSEYLNGVKENIRIIDLNSITKNLFKKA